MKSVGKISVSLSFLEKPTMFHPTRFVLVDSDNRGRKLKYIIENSFRYCNNHVRGKQQKRMYGVIAKISHLKLNRFDFPVQMQSTSRMFHIFPFPKKV